METMKAKEIERIRSLVPAGDTAQIQQALDDNLFKRKQGQVATINKDDNTMEFVCVNGYG